MVESDEEDCKFWKLDMLEESAKTVLEKQKRTIVDDFPIPKNINDSSTPEWLVKVMEEWEGYDPKLIIKRKVQKTDLDKSQSCLSMHATQLETLDFLTEEETDTLEKHWNLTQKRKGKHWKKLKTDDDQEEGLKVDLVDHELNNYKVDLRKWSGNNGKWKYVLTNGWNNVIDSEMFEANDDIQVWSFRYEQGKLCLALSPPTRSAQNSSSSTPSSSCQTIA
ncbi:PREDICTED: B3 domain-containing protein At2g31420-like [Camelina sativa]|uniref:B3 domain-containing protein At2g31420-like n=1 Tax=Camelina sativa TaxID=90675 RepID=A0ABM0ZBB1_CAMSA|nr:PREDICTED: B3 domain-containing protein At2g31420-like [Camelina sativa]